MAWEQLESAWPVHGSVLVHDDVLYCTAGRSMFLDGGLRFLRLEPATGKLLGEVVMDDRDPESGQDMHLAYLKKAGLVRPRREWLWMHYSLTPAAGPFHRGLLNCLNGCFQEVPVLQKDLILYQRRKKQKNFS